MVWKHRYKCTQCKRTVKTDLFPISSSGNRSRVCLNCRTWVDRVDGVKAVDFKTINSVFESDKLKFINLFGDAELKEVTRVVSLYRLIIDLPDDKMLMKKASMIVRDLIVGSYDFRFNRTISTNDTRRSYWFTCIYSSECEGLLKVTFDLKKSNEGMMILHRHKHHLRNPLEQSKLKKIAKELRTLSHEVNCESAQIDVSNLHEDDDMKDVGIIAPELFYVPSETRPPPFLPSALSASVPSSSASAGSFLSPSGSPDYSDHQHLENHIEQYQNYLNENVNQNYLNENVNENYVNQNLNYQHNAPEEEFFQYDSSDSETFTSFPYAPMTPLPLPVPQTSSNNQSSNSMGMFQPQGEVSSSMPCDPSSTQPIEPLSSNLSPDYSMNPAVLQTPYILQDMHNAPQHDLPPPPPQPLSTQPTHVPRNMHNMCYMQGLQNYPPPNFPPRPAQVPSAHRPVMRRVKQPSRRVGQTYSRKNPERYYRSPEQKRGSKRNNTESFQVRTVVPPNGPSYGPSLYGPNGSSNGVSSGPNGYPDVSPSGYPNGSPSGYPNGPTNGPESGPTGGHPNGLVNGLPNAHPGQQMPPMMPYRPPPPPLSRWGNGEIDPAFVQTQYFHIKRELFCTDRRALESECMYYGTDLYNFTCRCCSYTFYQIRLCKHLLHYNETENNIFIENYSLYTAPPFWRPNDLSLDAEILDDKMPEFDALSRTVNCRSVVNELAGIANDVGDPEVAAYLKKLDSHEISVYRQLCEKKISGQVLSNDHELYPLVDYFHIDILKSVLMKFPIN